MIMRRTSLGVYSCIRQRECNVCRKQLNRICGRFRLIIELWLQVEEERRTELFRSIKVGNFGLNGLMDKSGLIRLILYGYSNSCVFFGEWERLNFISLLFPQSKNKLWMVVNWFSYSNVIFFTSSTSSFALCQVPFPISGKRRRITHCSESRSKAYMKR